MRIAIIGAGFTGLSVAYQLSKKGYDIHVFEPSKHPGGLANGIKSNRWKWNLENHYHHWFSNDFTILNLAKEVGQKVIRKKCESSIFYENEIYKLDSPSSLMAFDKLSGIDRVRVGIVLGYLKLTPFYRRLEKITAKKFLVKWMGYRPWKILWKPLFDKKFGKYSSKIPASWFWGRIKKRSLYIVYPFGGFQNFADILVNKAKKGGVVFHFNEKVLKISKDGSFAIATDKNTYIFDKVVCTLPGYAFARIAKNLIKKYGMHVNNIVGLGAVNLLLRLNKSLLANGTYWLNINDSKIPFLVVIEHTNFMSKKMYDGEHLVYIGNYLDNGHKYFSKSANELIEIFIPFIQKINNNFDKKWILDSSVSKTNFAQPVIPLNYSSKVPLITTSVEGLYLASMEQVYPWDRGTNYAVELGEKVALEIINNE
jgi:protoporphyrinogen oxidase